jgi:hypothetical protein
MGLWDSQAFDQVVCIWRCAQSPLRGEPGAQVSAMPLVFSIEPTCILGSFDVEKIMIFDTSPNSIPLAASPSFA